MDRMPEVQIDPKVRPGQRDIHSDVAAEGGNGVALRGCYAIKKATPNRRPCCCISEISIDREYAFAPRQDVDFRRGAITTFVDLTNP